MKKHWFHIPLGGLILYLTASFSIALTCFDFQHSTFSVSLSAAFIFGALVTAFTLVYQRTTLVRQILSGFALQLVFWLLFILDSFIGISRSIVPLTDGNHAGGLVFVCFWLFFSVVSGVVIVCTAVAKIVAKIRSS